MTRKKTKKSHTRWLDKGFVPGFYGFCPDEKAWERMLPRFKTDLASCPYPDTAGRCTIFEKSGTDMVCCVVTISEEASRSSPDRVAGLLVHEATHVWQAFREAMGEKSPSHEFEAYVMQMIFLQLLHAYEKTRGRLYRRKKDEMQ